MFDKRHVVVPEIDRKGNHQGSLPGAPTEDWMLTLIVENLMLNLKIAFTGFDIVSLSLIRVLEKFPPKKTPN